MSEQLLFVRTVAKQIRNCTSKVGERVFVVRQRELNELNEW